MGVIFRGKKASQEVSGAMQAARRHSSDEGETAPSRQP